MGSNAKHILESAQNVLARFQSIENGKQDFTAQAVAETIRYSRDYRESVRRSIHHSLKTWRQHIDTQQERNRSDGHLFNPLHFFKINEPKHSKLLGFLLNPKANHGQGSDLLVSFLKLLKVPTPSEGTWHISVERGHIDILLTRAHPCSVIIIENKCHNAIDQRYQLYRYWHQVIHPHVRNGNYEDPRIRDAFQIIYLPSGEHKKPSQDSLTRPHWLNDPLPAEVPLKYKLHTFNELIANWAHECAKAIPPENLRLRTYLDFYSELCRSL